jgi:hypothetical protein
MAGLTFVMISELDRTDEMLESPKIFSLKAEQQLEMAFPRGGLSTPTGRKRQRARIEEQLESPDSVSFCFEQNQFRSHLFGGLNPKSVLP